MATQAAFGRRGRTPASSGNVQLMTIEWSGATFSMPDMSQLNRYGKPSIEFKQAYFKAAQDGISLRRTSSAVVIVVRRDCRSRRCRRSACVLFASRRGMGSR